MPRLLGDKNPNWRGGKVAKRCLECGDEFLVKQGRAGTAKFCCLEHANAWQSKHGVQYSRLGKRTLRECAYCGARLSVLKSREKKTERSFCSAECHFAWRSEKLRDEGNPNWLGGTSRLPYPHNWREISRGVIERDGGRMNPGCDGDCSTLNAHHIDYHKENVSDCNLITLCARCHARANFGRNEWELLFRGILDA